jgi:hypothetical protein
MELTEEQKQKIEENRRQALKRLQEAKRKRSEEEIREKELNELAVEAESKRKKSTLTCTVIDEETQEICGKSPVNESLYNHFQLTVCRSCKRACNLYECITKSECVTEYLITEDIIKSMPYMERDNPHNPGWKPMKLYLRKHALEAALNRFGSIESLHQEKKRREAAKLDKNIIDTEDFLSNASASLRNELSGISKEESTSMSSSLSKMLDFALLDSSITSSSLSLPTDLTQPTSKTMNKKAKASSKAAKRKLFIQDLAATIRGDASTITTINIDEL